MKYTAGDRVLSIDHPKAVGTVVREMPDGLVIEFVTPSSENLPFGHVITEFWVSAELEQLVSATEYTAPVVQS